MTVAEGAFAYPTTKRPATLQWGRNLTVAEGIKNDVNARRRRLASMGPQLDSCGREAVIDYLRAKIRFNGAAT